MALTSHSPRKSLKTLSICFILKVVHTNNLSMSSFNRFPFVPRHDISSLSMTYIVYFLNIIIAKIIVLLNKIYSTSLFVGINL